MRDVPGVLYNYAYTIRGAYFRDRENVAAERIAHVPEAAKLIRLCGGANQARETLELVAAIAEVWEVY